MDTLEQRHLFEQAMARRNIPGTLGIYTSRKTLGSGAISENVHDVWRCHMCDGVKYILMLTRNNVVRTRNPTMYGLHVEEQCWCAGEKINGALP